MSSAGARVPKPTDPRASIASALRTLDTERDGLAALAEAMTDGLGDPFASTVATIRAARGRVIVTGMGKSGHIGRKIAATLASTGTPAFFVHAAEASHGDLGMITSDDVMLALSWSGETEELKDLDQLFAPLPHHADRRHRQRRQRARQGRRHRAGVAAGAGSLPAQSCAHHLLADAAGARRRAGDGAARKPRIHRGRLRRVSSAAAGSARR